MPPYAGLSAYCRRDAPDSERNARMVAIGILVPSSGRYGRLGRAWNHAPQLKVLARYLTASSNADIECTPIIPMIQNTCKFTLTAIMIQQYQLLLIP